MVTKEQIKWVNEWFKACKDKNLKPWEWDFKRFYCEKYKQPTDNSIEFWLTYKNGLLRDSPALNITGAKGLKADFDKEVKKIYEIIWGVDESDNIKGETINSFKTTFNKAIILSNNRFSTYEETQIDPKILLSNQYNILFKEDNFEKFQIINDNLQEFQLFARNTSCIGNFMAIPPKMNLDKNRSSKDYIDVFLYKIYRQMELIDKSQSPLIDSNDIWKMFVQHHYLQPYIKNDAYFSVSEFWKGHFKNAIPKKSEHIDQFLKFVNPAIEERGKWLVKLLCEKCRLTSYDFYDEIKDMDRPPFSNELK
ncbi:hypothetical protein [Holzapfeliella sp. JNUCC 72]